MQDIPIKVIQTTEQFYEVYYALRGKQYISIDTEATDLNPHKAKLLLISLYAGDVAYVLDMTKLPVSSLELIRDILEDETIIKVGHNLIVEYKMIYKAAKIMMRGFFDCMIVDRMLYAGLTFVNGEKLRYGLKDLVARYLGIEVDKEIRQSFIGATTLREFSEEQLKYSGMDAVYPYHIMFLQQEKIKEKELQRIHDLEMSIIPVTAFMEFTGIAIDKSKLESMITPFEQFVKSADLALQDLFIKYGAADNILFSKDGYEVVNTASHDQMYEALQKVGIEIRDKRGKLSLNSKVVQRYDMLQSKKKGKKGYKDFEIDYHELVEDEDVADALDLYLGLDNPFLRAHSFVTGARKLLSTYVCGLLKSIDDNTGRVYPNFNSYGAAATGRYSSNNPNFQNLPNDKKLKRLGLGELSIRQCLVAGKGRKFIIADFSGIELVILAALSGDDHLMDQILRGDIHLYVTKEVLGYDKITPENKKKEPYRLWRDASKPFSYGIAYGVGGKNVSETLSIMLASENYKISPAEGDDLIEKWYKLFPKAAKYLQSNAQQAIERGYVCDVWGRRRNWNKKDLVQKWIRLAAEREAKNAPIQSTSATMTKVAESLIWDELDIKRGRILFCVHDEIVLEVVNSYVEEALEITKKSMEESIRLLLPSIAHEVGKYETLSVFPAVSERYDK